MNMRRWDLSWGVFATAWALLELYLAITISGWLSALFTLYACVFVVQAVAFFWRALTRVN